MLDLNKEIEKAGKRIEAINLSVDKLRKQMQLPEYDTKIPEEVRKTNSEMVCGSVLSQPSFDLVKSLQSCLSSPNLF